MTSPRSRKPQQFMDRIYASPLSDVLEDLGNEHATPGSGAACALVLSLAVEALQSQLSLTLRREELPQHRPFHVVLQSALKLARSEAEQLYALDATAFADVIEQRYRRDHATSPEAKRACVEAEVECLHAANAVLGRITRWAKEIADHASVMYDGRGVERARGEASASRYFAQAAANAAAEIVALNVNVLAVRRRVYNVSIGDLSNLQDLVRIVPSERAASCLHDAIASARRADAQA